LFCFPDEEQKVSNLKCRIARQEELMQESTPTVTFSKGGVEFAHSYPKAEKEKVDASPKRPRRKSGRKSRG
jgi:hypothetical protein